VSDRITFVGTAGGDELARSYANARAVIYAPFDEDYGYVTLEAFLCAKPVITATDSGGTLEFVVNGENGFVCDPTPEAIGVAATRLAEDAALAARTGQRGSRARSPDHLGWRGGAAPWLIPHRSRS
jgi:glycosyltransferase involved in cell wall biosynthesis